MSAIFVVKFLLVSFGKFIFIHLSNVSLVVGEKFQTRPILRKHKKKHDAGYQHECLCKICYRQYVSRPHLLRHLKVHHSAPDALKSDEIEEFVSQVEQSREK